MTAPAGGAGRANPSLVIAAMCWAVIMITASVASAVVALPAISEALQATQVQLQWIVNGYPLVIATLLMPAGALLDRFGRRRGLVGGLALLAVGLGACGLASSASQLIACRLLAGLGAAFVFPGTLATITTVVPAAQRSGAIGLWAGSTMLGAVVGGLLGGVLTEVAWWGSVFVVSGAAVAGCLLLTLVAVPETRDPEHARLDPVGAVLSAVGVGAVVFGLSEAPVRGWTHPLALLSLVGVAILIGFSRWELRVRRPLLDLRLFDNRSFRLGTLVTFISWFATYGCFFVSIQYLAYVLGYQALTIGLAYLPTALLLVPLAVYGPALSGRFGRRLVVSGAFAMMLAGAAAMALVGPRADYWPVIIAICVFLGGVGLQGGPASEAIVEALPGSEQGVASAVNDTARELGAALGIAVVGSAFNAGYRGRVGELLVGAGTDLVAVAKSSPAAGLQTGRQLSADGAHQQLLAIHHSVIAGWDIAMATVAVILAAAMVLVIAQWPAADRPHVPADSHP